MPDYGWLLGDVIGKGKQNAVSNHELQQIMHASRREVSAVIHELRSKGTIICGTTCGYFIAESDEELLDGYNVLWKRAVSLLSVLKPMRAEIKKRGLLPLTAEMKSRQRGKDEQKAESTGLSDR